MKFVIILSVVFVSANAALDKEYFDRIMKEASEAGKKCAAEVGATTDDVTELVSYSFPPSTHEGKCVLHCMYKHYKMMKDGKLDKEATIAAFDEVKKMDADLHGKVLKIIDACSDKGADLSDPCEVASAMATCSKGEAEAMGISKDSLFASQ